MADRGLYEESPVSLAVCNLAVASVLTVERLSAMPLTLADCYSPTTTPQISFSSTACLTLSSLGYPVRSPS